MRIEKHDINQTDHAGPFSIRKIVSAPDLPALNGAGGFLTIDVSAKKHEKLSDTTCSRKSLPDNNSVPISSFLQYYVRSPLTAIPKSDITDSTQRRRGRLARHIKRLGGASFPRDRKLIHPDGPDEAFIAGVCFVGIALIYAGHVGGAVLSAIWQ